MKKRNKPIVLATLLALMIGAVAFVQFPRDALQGQHGAGDGHDHGGAEEPPKTGNDVQVQDKNSLASSVASSVKSGGPGAGRPGGPPGRPDMAGTPPGKGSGAKSLIEVQKYAPMKPVYNESATSTQWYGDEAPKAPPKGK